jgi:hypothetical protein
LEVGERVEKSDQGADGGREVAMAVARIVGEAEDYDVNIAGTQLSSSKLYDNGRDTLDQLSKLLGSENFLLLVDNCVRGLLQR